MKRFNIRVYGIIINEREEVLVSDEDRFGRSFTKFPGGGLDWGEGLSDCIERELQEELGLAVTCGSLFYVNDFFQVSAFREEDQLMSFYYRIELDDYNAIDIESASSHPESAGEQFRWLSLADISEDHFTFPIDKIVANKLRDL